MSRSIKSHLCLLRTISIAFTDSVVYELAPTKTTLSIRIERLLLTSEKSEVSKSLGYYAIKSGIAQMSATAKCITLGKSLVSLLSIQTLTWWMLYLSMATPS